MELFDIELPGNLLVIDHSNALRSGFLASYPEASIMSDWAHLFRNETMKRCKQLDDADGELTKLWKRSLSMLHNARTMEQFVQIAHVIERVMASHGLTAIQFFNGFKATYLAPDWCRWFATCSGVLGVTPNSNDGESHNRRLKASSLLRLRMRIDYALHTAFPKMMFSDAGDIKAMGRLTRVSPIEVCLLVSCV